jgi:alpha-N-arabinofuranosidase
MIASGPNGNDMRWSRGFMDRLEGGAPHGWAMHYYEGGAAHPLRFTADQMKEQFARYAKVEEAIQQQRSLLDSYRDGRKINLILDEWGVWDQIAQEDEKKYGALWQQSTMRSAVAAGLGLNIFNRQADKLYMCNIAQIVNVLQSLLLTDGPEGKNCVRTTTYHAFSLFKDHRSNTAVRVQTEDSSPVGLSVSASKRNGELLVSLVNPHPDTDLDVDCTLHGVTGKAASAVLLHSSDLNAYNSFESPNQVVPKPLKAVVEGSRLRLELPRLSVATVKLRTNS